MAEDVLRLPRHVDEQPILLVWSADEVMAFFSLFILGFLLEMIPLFVVAGYFVVKFTRRFRNTKPDGYMLHAGYWYGLPLPEARTLPNPYESSFR